MKTEILQKSKHIILSSILCITVAFTATAQSYTLTDDDVVVENGVITSCSYNFAIKDIIIPETLDGQTVTGIAESRQGVFSGKGITSVKLPFTIESIGDKAFYFNYITTLDLSSCTALTNIGYSAFEKNSLRSLDLNGCSALINIDSYAFIGNRLTKLNLSGCSALTNIGEYAFRGNGFTALCLTTLDLSDCSALTNIGRYAFVDNMLTMLDLSGCSALTSIGEAAFKYSNLTELDLSGCVALTSIGQSAFFNNSLRSLDLNGCSALTSIGSHAFYKNELTTLDLSNCNALMNIWRSAFNENSLTSFTLPVNTLYENFGWTDSDGNIKTGGNEVSNLATSYNVPVHVLSDEDVVVKNGVITSCPRNFTFKNIIIPETLDEQTVTGIADANTTYSGVFSKKGITSLHLPTTIKRIGNYAFIENSLTTLELSGCTALTSIGGKAFFNNSIESLDLSNCMVLMNIGGNAFAENSLTSFTLPTNTITEYFGWTDSNGNIYTGGDEVSNLAIRYSVPAYILTDDDVVVENGVITSCSYNFAIKDIIIPETLDGQTVTGIAESIPNNPNYYKGVFKDKGITSVLLPATIKNIGNAAFASNSLTSLDLSNCPALTSIGQAAFSSNNLKNINIGNCMALTNIGAYAFNNNIIDTINLSDCTALMSIGGYSFYNNPLSSFTLPVNTKYADFSWVDNMWNNYAGGTTIRELGRYYYISAATYTLTGNDVVVENGIITSCSNDFLIKNIYIPETLDGQTIIGIAGKSYFRSGVFYGKRIQSLSLSPTIESIGKNAFYLNRLTTLNLSGCSALISIGEHAFVENSIDTINLSGCSALISIGEQAFSRNNLTSLDLSDCSALSSIDDHAFYENPISTLDLSNCTALTNIGQLAFYCNSLITLDLSTNTALASIGHKAFSNNNLTTLDLSGCSALISIGRSAFSLNSLNKLDLSSCTALTNIGAYAFYANSLTTLDLSGCSALTSVEEGAFLRNNLTTLGLSDCKALTYIGDQAFSENSLDKFNLPENKQYENCLWEDNKGETFAAGDVVSNFTREYFLKEYFVVKFYDWDETELKSVNVISGNDATPPADPVRESYTFTGWDTTFTNITESYDVTAEYEISTYVITFLDWDGTGLKTETIEYGSDATAPADPVREGYTFTGWDTTFTNITESYDITAEYEIKSSVTKTMNSVLELYPNPTKGMLYVSGKAGWQIQLFTLSGQRLQQIVMNNKNTQLNLSECPEGTYILKVGNDSEQVVRKVVKK